MNKLFGFFLIFSIIFGMFGGAFGAPINPNYDYFGVVKFNYWGPDSSYNILFDKKGKISTVTQGGVDKTKEFLNEYYTYTRKNFLIQKDTVFDLATKISKTANSNYFDNSFVNLNGIVYNKKNALSIKSNLVKKTFNGGVPNLKTTTSVTNSIVSTNLNQNTNGGGSGSNNDGNSVETKTTSKKNPPNSKITTVKKASIITCKNTDGTNCPSGMFFDSSRKQVYKKEVVPGTSNGAYIRKYLDNSGNTVMTTDLVSFNNLIQTFKKTTDIVLEKNAKIEVKAAFAVAKGQILTQDQIDFMKIQEPGIKLLALDNTAIRNSIDTTKLDSTQKKFVLSSVYSDLSTNILNDASNSDIKDLCSGNLNSKCINTMVKDSVLTARLPTLIDSESILVDSNTIALILADPTISQEIKDKLQSSFLKKDCAGSINPFCKFTSKINQREAYINNLNSQIEIAKLNGLNIGENGESIKINGEDVICGSTCYEVILANCNGDKTCIENGASQLKQKAKAVDYKITNKNSFDVYLKQSGLNLDSQTKTACQKNLNSACESAIKKACKDNSKGNCADILAGFSVLRDQQLVQTNAIFDTINALANPDFDALNAAKLFGFEPNYNNVPKMLRTPFASQICSAKISGYLDKDLTNSGGGVTSYGCDKTITENYDVNTGIYVNSDPNCLKVLLDFRAQRAQITPDNKVSITYSLYLKAPPKINIKYFLAIKYLLKDKTTKKQLLKPNKNVFEFTGIGGVSKQDDTVDVNLNISKNLIEDSKTSFSLSILARYPDGRIYQHKTIPIILISATDSYVGILAGNGVSSGAINSVGGGASLTPAPLTPADMLGMI